MRKLLLLSVASLIVFLGSAAAQQPAEADRLRDVPDINGMAVTLIKPAFPETAVAVDGDGTTVTVRVTVDENGNPTSATCSLTCHSMLKDAAELAALQSKFRPLIDNGKALKYQGILHYTFVVNRVDWFRLATAIESTRQFDNISLGPVAQILSPEFSNEKTKLLALDENGGAEYKIRQKSIVEVVESVKSKLKGNDLWWFELGLALRRVTFWPQAGGPIERAELQDAIDDLGPIVSRAPDGVGEELINEISAISRYRVPQNIPEGELRRAIAEFSRRITLHSTNESKRRVN